MTQIDPTNSAKKGLELVASMSHENGNLLAALKTWLDAPGFGVPAPEALANAAKIVEKMQKVQKAEQLCVTGLRHDETTRIALSDLLEHALALVTPRLRARGATITVESLHQSVELACNPGRTIANLFFMVLDVAGQPKDERRNVVLSADPEGEAIRFTAFLASAASDRKALMIPAVFRG